MGRRRQRSDPESEFDSTESPGWVDGGWRLIQGLIQSKLSKVITNLKSELDSTDSPGCWVDGPLVEWRSIGEEEERAPAPHMASEEKERKSLFSNK